MRKLPLRVFRVVALSLSLLVVTGGVLTARVILDGQAELSASDKAFDAGELTESIAHARRSATLYAPGAPHVGRAYARLRAIALGAEATGQHPVALEAWRAMRAAALESRHLWVPHQAELELANEHLAQLSARAAKDNPLVNSEAVVARARKELARDNAPRGRWLLVLTLGFFLVGAGFGVFARFGITREGGLSAAGVRWGVTLAVLGAACWGMAVWKA